LLDQRTSHLDPPTFVILIVVGTTAGRTLDARVTGHSEPANRVVARERQGNIVREGCVSERVADDDGG
jgi:hypothetical protein